MITLALLKLLEEKGFGKIDETLFWQTIGLAKKGLYIANIGSGGGERGKRRVQRFEIYSIGKNNLDGLRELEKVAKFLRNNFEINKLPSVEGEDFENVAIMPPSTVSNVGENEQGRMVYSITGEIYY